MANHVYAYLEIDFKSQDDIESFSEWIDYDPTALDYSSKLQTCCDSMLEQLYPDKEDTASYYIDNLGAKWIYFDDVDKSFATFTISWTTAWDFPEKLFNKLTEYLQSNYQDFTMSCTFEDEGFGFVGAAASNNLNSDCEYYYPESELEEYRDEDDCLTDEFYEIIVEQKQVLLNEMLEFIKQPKFI